MYTLISEAAKNAVPVSKAVHAPKILVVGCGGAGNNSINRLHRIGIDGAQTLAINTDELHLMCIRADKKLLIGKTTTRGLGTGGDPDKGMMCAEEARDEIRRAIGRPDMTFITVGMGGGTGTGVAPVVAEIAREHGSIVVVVATTPFKIERGRIEKAKIGIRRVKKWADCTIVLDNNRLLEIVPRLPMDEALSVMDQLISELIKGVTETVAIPSLINVDYADVRAIMKDSGTATVLYGEASEEDPAKVVMDALKNPLMDIDYTGARGALVHITGGRGLSLSTAHEVVAGITEQLDATANVIFGARIVPDFEGRIRVIAIMTGVHSPSLIESVREAHKMSTAEIEIVGGL